MTTRNHGRKGPAVRVVPSPGGWAIKREGSARALSVHASRAEAVKAAKIAAREAPPVRAHRGRVSRKMVSNAPTVIGAFEAKTNLGQILDRVAAGDTVVITKRGVPVAKIVPFDDEIDREHVRDVVDAFMARGTGARLASGVAIKDLVSEGRR